MKKYDNYKDSGIEWIGEIPEHWEVKPFKHLVICNSEALTEKTNPEMEINYIEIGDVNSFDGIKETSKYTFEKAPSRARRIVREGDVIISTVRTYLKAITSISSKFDGFIASTGFAVLTPKLIHSGFLGNIALCEGLIGEIISLSKGVSYPSITSQDLTNISIPFPSKNEQNAIANYLDHKTTQIDTLIAKKEQFICLLQEERTAVINQAVTKGLDPKVKMKDSGIEWLGEIPEHWKLMRVGSLSQCITGFAFKSDNFSFENGIKIVRGDNVTENSLRWGDKTRYWNEYSEVLDRFQLQKNDIVIGMDGSKVGKNYAYVEEKDLPLLLVQRVARIRSNSELIAKWIHFNIGTYNFKYYINLSKTDPAIPHITLKNITSYPICIPDINELNLIIEKLNSKLEKLDETLKKSKQEIELLKEYKTALISEVVTGKVDVRDVILN